MACTLEERIKTRQATLNLLKREKAASQMLSLLVKTITRAKYQGWQLIQERASGYLRNQREIGDIFEMIEQEKAVLEEEFGNALTLNEDL